MPGNSGEFRRPSFSMPAVAARGTLLGTAIVGGVERFVTVYGRAAGHAVIDQLAPTTRMWIDPHAPALGFLGARRYPYAVVGEVLRTMSKVVRASNEDEFVREIAVAGLDAALGTVARGALRVMITPSMLASHVQEVWDEFHDSGRLEASAPDGANEYVTTVREWTGHDPTVCKVCSFACASVLSRMGKDRVETSRLACVAWGDPACTTRVRWGA
jgi:hypothetical protein